MVKKKRNFLLITLIGMLIAVMSLTSCGISDIISGDEEDKDYTESKDIYLAMAPVRTLNPTVSKDEDTYMISKVVYDSLFELNSTMTPEPKLVDSYKFDSSDESLTMDLVQGVRFHDGTELNADDVKFSIDAYMEAGTDSLYHNHVKNIEEVTAAGKYKVKIYYQSAKDISLAYLTFPILSSGSFKSVNSLINKDDEFIPVGTGAYKYESFDEDKALKLVPNKDYFGKKADNNLIFKVLPDKKYQFGMIESGNLSVVFSDLQDRYAMVSDPDISHVDFPNRSVEYIAFNCENGATIDVRVRKAIAYAIDAKDIRKECYFNTCMATDTLYYPGYMGCKTEKNFYDADDEKANEYFEKAGCKDVDGDGILDIDGRKVDLDLLVLKNDECRMDAANIIKETLSNYRVSVNVVALDRHDLYSKLSAGKFDMYIGGYDFDESFDLRPLVGESATNYTRFEDFDINDKLDILRSGVDVSETKELVSEIKEKLSDEIPYYPILYKTCGAIVSEQMKEPVKSQFNNYLKYCQKWKCKFEKTVDN